MLSIDDSFFKAETRNDFFINERMKHVWAAELKVLDIFDKICARNGLLYFVTYGTLLGAVRHKGFVPWDDDIDIFMPRADYEKFCRIHYKELPGYFSFNSYVTDPEHNCYHSAITNRSDIGENELINQRFYDCPFIIGMDIFPIDYINRDDEIEKVRRLLFNATYDIALKRDEYESDGQLPGLLDQIEELCKVSIDRSGNIRNQLWFISNQLAAMFTEEESDVMATMTSGVTTHGVEYFDKRDVASTVELPFEMTKVKAPIGYDRVLRAIYRDYTIIRNYNDAEYGQGHDYPFFKKQIPYLTKPEKYTVTEEQ